MTVSPAPSRLDQSHRPVDQSRGVRASHPREETPVIRPTGENEEEPGAPGSSLPKHQFQECEVMADMCSGIFEQLTHQITFDMCV